MWYEPFNSIESGYITHLKVSLGDKIIYRPGSCLITPKTPLLVAICCLGYQSETKPHERRFHTSTAPASVAKTTDFLMKPFTRCIILPRWVQYGHPSYLQWSHCESAHVVPEDQGALWPSGGDDRSPEVSGLTIAATWAVCTQIPTLQTASIREKTESTEQTS